MTCLPDGVNSLQEGQKTPDQLLTIGVAKGLTTRPRRIPLDNIARSPCDLG
jgi:hypothetical protein